MAGMVTNVLMLTLALVIQVFAQTPVILPFTKPVNIHEDTIIETTLVQVKCSNAGDACICNVKDMTPANGPFTVWNKPPLTGYWCYYTGQAQGGTLSFKTTPTYSITIECRNTYDNATATATLEVDVQQNQAPEIKNTNYPRETLTLDATKPYAAGEVIYTVTATDAENDPLTFSISTSPSVNYFSIGSKDGLISTTIDLRAATEKYIVVTVTVKDKVNTVNDFEIFITITNMNARPQITNLPATLNILENEASGYNIMTLTFSDLDYTVPQIPTCTVVPSGEQYKFTYESGTHKLRLSTLTGVTNPLDYETINQYKITCVLNDGFLDSQGDVLTLNVQNVNEPPTFDEIAYYCDLDESNTGGSSCNLNAVIVDPEGDLITSVAFVSGNNSNRFRYDRSTSTISFNVDYDVDASTYMQTSVILQLQATDVYGAYKIVPVYINIHDANDNTCSFGATATLTFKADQSTSLGSLGTFSAKDNDLTSPNNLVSYEVVQALPSDSSNYIAVYTDGAIAYTSLIPESNTGKSYSLVVRCKDGGSPQRTAQGTVVLTYQVTTTTTVTTTSTTTTASTSTTSTTTASSNLFDNDAFVAVFAILMCLLVLGLLVGLYFLLKYCGLCGAASAGNICGANGCNDFCCPK
ncbi:protocadherin Fat 4-like [Physella acuta]|uniref:protocadherin Fat 4-like n=1 Tax=Physella acuta TaxID=109671 RepID=UPI0027DC857C|nr:protocadherin Fat 4-like [Physella acuta]